MSDSEQMVGKVARGLSTVAFPYNDLDDAIGVARAMHAAGGVPLDRDQLAAKLGISSVGGNFSLKLSGARMFGLITGGSGRVELTPLGFEILDPPRERAAKVDAFLNVELYRKLYESFKGRTLPPRPAGLEQAMVSLGVSQKQRDKARQAFDRSARTAGFFPNAAEDRLVAPVLGVQPGPEPTSQPDGNITMEQASLAAQALLVVPPRPTSRALNPFIEGLLEEIPDKGAPWSIDDQANWLQAAAQIFRILYKGDGEIMVTVKKAGN